MKENIFIIVFIILNIFLSYKIFKDDYYENKQKFIQFLIIWLIPILGGLIVYFFLNRSDNTNKNSLESSNRSFDSNMFLSGED